MKNFIHVLYALAILTIMSCAHENYKGIKAGSTVFNNYTGHHISVIADCGWGKKHFEMQADEKEKRVNSKCTSATATSQGIEVSVGSPSEKSIHDMDWIYGPSQGVSMYTWHLEKTRYYYYEISFFNETKNKKERAKEITFREPLYKVFDLDTFAGFDLLPMDPRIPYIAHTTKREKLKARYEGLSKCIKSFPEATSLYFYRAVLVDSSSKAFKDIYGWSHGEWLNKRRSDIDQAISLSPNNVVLPILRSIWQRNEATPTRFYAYTIRKGRPEDNLFELGENWKDAEPEKFEKWGRWVLECADGWKSSCGTAGGTWEPSTRRWQD